MAVDLWWVDGLRVRDKIRGNGNGTSLRRLFLQDEKPNLLLFLLNLFLQGGAERGRAQPQ